MVAQQKYDGANLEIEFTEENEVKFFSRNMLITYVDSFFSLGQVISNLKYNSLIETIKKVEIESTGN